MATAGRVLGLVGVAAGSAGFTACLAALATGMRNVMESNGGSCASGGPFAINPSQVCSSADTRLLLAGILGTLGYAAVIAASTALVRGPLLGSVLLMWGSVFGVLGWTFIDLAMHPPAGLTGVAGWYLSGALFVAMAAAGAVPGIALVVQSILRPDAADAPIDPTVPVAPIVRARRRAGGDGP